MAADDLVQVLLTGSRHGAPPARELIGLLDERERERATEAEGSSRQARFVTARAALRLALGRHLGVRPTELAIEEGPNGKPVLRGGRCFFNVSHTGDLVAVAIRDRGPVGVDLESTLRMVRMPEILRRTLTPRERRALKQVPVAATKAAFLQAWCRKEAYAKGVAVGLGLDFRTLELSWEGVATVGDPPWEVRSLTLHDPYVGAVAASADGWALEVGFLSW